jgi:adenylate kinase
MIMRAIILLGAPGAGKGTVAAELSEKTDYKHVSTGDILRDAVKRGSAVGLEAKAYMERGDLVPDDVIIRLVKDRIAAGAANECYMFDGFPRTLAQAELLEDVIVELNGELAFVFLLEVGEEVVVERLTGRRVCRDCGAVYHVKNIPPKVAGVCDKCGGELYQRADDTEATVRNRLEVYRAQTADLIGHYEDKGLLVRVDAAQGKDLLEDEIIARLEGSESAR